METVQDFEDLLSILEKRGVEYLIVGGLAFIFHAKPRYTKDIDIWLNSTDKNIQLANAALDEFGAPYTLTLPPDNQEILQLGLPPNRIDLLQSVGPIDFPKAWKNRIRDNYGCIQCNWISLEDLICIKQNINHPRHQDDARILKQVREIKTNS